MCVRVRVRVRVCVCVCVRAYDCQQNKGFMTLAILCGVVVSELFVSKAMRNGEARPTFLVHKVRGCVCVCVCM